MTPSSGITEKLTIADVRNLFTYMKLANTITGYENTAMVLKRLNLASLNCGNH